MSSWLARRLASASLLLLGALSGACGGDTPGNSESPAGAGPTSGGTGGSSVMVQGGAGSPPAGGAAGAASAGRAGGGAGNRAGEGGLAAGNSAGGVSGGGDGNQAGTASGSGGTATATGGGGGAGGSRYDGPFPPSVTELFPVPGSSDVCVDVPLTITFAVTPSIGQSGTIRIYAKSNPNSVVDSIDVAAGSYSDTVGGQSRNLVRPIFIDGKSAVVYFHQHKLAPSTTYFVNVSSGAFVDAQQKPIGTVTDQSFTFTTGPAPVASSDTHVDRTGTAPFCTIQGAFDAIFNDGAARTITVAPGTYHELLYLSAKKNLTLRGADRTGTVIQYPNNDKLNAGTSARPLFFANGSTGLRIETLTLHNTTPQGGSQAEALRVAADQVTLRSVTLKSLQDTLMSSGKVYIVDSYIEGNVDFIWGNGPTYIERSEIKTVGRAGAIVQARNGSANYGFVFVDSKLTADPQVSGQVLARIDATEYPASNVAFINCQMTAIASKGWTITPDGTTATGQLRFWEYQSTDPSGAPLAVGGRVSASKQLTAAEAASVRDKATVLGGWTPP